MRSAFPGITVVASTCVCISVVRLSILTEFSTVDHESSSTDAFAFSVIVSLASTARVPISRLREFPDSRSGDGLVPLAMYVSPSGKTTNT